MNTDQYRRQTQGIFDRHFVQITVKKFEEKNSIYEQQHKIPRRFDGAGVSAAKIAASNVSLRFS